MNLLNHWLGGDANRRDESQLDNLASKDPFLAEALEGYREFPEANHVEDISKMKVRLREKYQKKERRIIPIRRFAAIAAIFIGIFGTFWLINQSIMESGDLAQNQSEAIEKTTAAPSGQGEHSNKELIIESSDDEIIEAKEEESSPLNDTYLDSKSNTNQYKAPTENKPQKEKNKTIATDENIPEPVSQNQVDEIMESPKPNFETTEVIQTAPKNTEIVERESELLAEEDDLEYQIGNEYKAAEKEDTFISGDVEGGMEEASRSLGDALLFGQDAPNTPREIKGIVTDRRGEPLIGANITIPGTQNRTTTDFSGNFKLNLSEKDKQLEISYTGYSSQIVPVDSQSLVQIELNEGELLDEAIVTKKRKSSKKRNQASASSYSNNLPIPKKGVEKFREYLQKNQKYPSKAAETNIQGEVVLRFLVNENGSLSNIRVEKSLSTECDAEAIRVLEKGPKWEANSPQETTWTFNFPIEK